ncbi:MAG: hypothetical protein QG670_2292 [Thermoproteota archaeon]|nr:hypothetical protein [Thermoproteota archaeon]
MICPKCNKDALLEKVDSNGKIETVICSNCGFESSPLEYHAWKHIKGKKPPKGTVPYSRRTLDSQEPFDYPEISLGELERLWERISVPMIAILLTLVFITIIVIVRALIPMN